MKKEYITCLIYGKIFNPDMLLGLEPFSRGIIQRKGEIAKFGRYKNNKLPYSSLITHFENENPLKKALIFLTENMELINQSNAEEVTVTLNIECQGQNNFNLEADDIRSLFLLNLSLNFNFSISFLQTST